MCVGGSEGGREKFCQQIAAILLHDLVCVTHLSHSFHPFSVIVFYVLYCMNALRSDCLRWYFISSPLTKLFTGCAVWVQFPVRAERFCLLARVLTYSDSYQGAFLGGK